MVDKDKKKKNIAFTGGGTGGHVTPISSLIEYLQSHDNLKASVDHLCWFGTEGQLEEKACSKFDDVEFVSISSGKLRRELSLKSIVNNLLDLWRCLIGLGESRVLLRQHNIDVVFCKGGYVALPVCLAAWLLRIPVLVHESDMHVGLVNKIVSSFAQKSFVGFPGAIKDAEVVGQILSPKLLIQKKADVSLFEKHPEKKTLLVLCGSQGAKVVFDQLLQELDKGGQIVKSLQIVVVLGLLNVGYAKHFADYEDVVYFDFLDVSQLRELYTQADFALTRGSATTLAEMELFGIPKLIVPLPSHDQPLNAEWYKEKHGDVVLDQKEIGDVGKRLEELVLLEREEHSLLDGELLQVHKIIWESLLSN